MLITADSHLDHGLGESAIEFIRERFAERAEFFIETFELPEEFGELVCGLRGPIVGDAPITEDRVRYETRGDRPGKSRITGLPPLATREVTVIAGPHGDEPCVLYTAYGGPLAPREPFDETLSDEDRAESEAFWAEHAISFGAF